MKKKLLILLLSATLLLILFILGCDNTSTQDENTLTLLAKTSDIEQVYIQRIIDQYVTQTGNEINITTIENASFDKEASTMFDQGNIPDLFIHFNDAELSHYNVSENFYYMNNESWLDELTDASKAYCLDDNENILGLPFWENSISGCYYNKTILDNLGLRPAYTQEEFNVLCQTLKDVGYTPMYWSANGCNWMFQFGLDPIFADNPELLEKLNKNEITYADIPKVRDMIEWLDNANKKGWFNTDYATATWDNIAPAMGNGESVTLFAWDTWFSMNLAEKNKYSTDDFALMPVFMNTTTKGTYEGGNLAMIMANKNSPRLNQALDFLSFCAKPENYNVAFDGISTVNCFKNQTTNIQASMVTDAMVSIETNQRVSTAWPRIIGYKQDDVGAAVLEMFQGKVDVDGCIKLMDEYRINAAKEMNTEGF